MRRTRHTYGFMACAMLFVVVLAVAATPAAATDVTYSGQKIVISQPGTYVLKNDITNSNQMICIEIQASNVVFDGGGHLIDGVDAESSAGIYVHGPSSAVSGVTIKNVRMQDWYYGIYLHEAKSSRIEASTLSSNAFTGAVVYKNAVGNTVTGCTITGNSYGLVFSDGAANGVVSNNEINQNERGLYVYLSDGIAVTGNRLANNINNGIQLHTSGGGSIYNNRLNNNLNVAFLGEPFKANAWSVTPGTAWSPANIVGGPKVGGNYWSRPDGTGFSQQNADANGDGFIDIPLTIAEQNIDNYPLALYTGVTPVTTVPTTVVTTAPTQGAQTPYRAVTLPGRLEAENYDLGGEGVAYHDVEAANLGGAYRTSEGVDVESKNGITNVAYIRAGEWTEYTVNVPTAGTYPATFRVAAWATGRQIAVSVDGVQKATASLPNTGSYTSWKTVTVQVPLEAGTHVIRFAFNTDKQNLDYVDFGAPTGTTVVPTTVATTGAPTQQAGQTPYNGPHALPGTVQAEDFDNGGQNVAYWDSTVENKAKTNNKAYADRGNEYVDAETGNGIANIGWITDGEWTEYTVEVAAAGSYTANFRVGSWVDGRKVVLTVDGASGCTVNVPNTGSNTAFTTVSAPLTLAQGTHTIRLTFQGASQNIDWFSVTGGPAPTATATVAPTETTNATPTTTVSQEPTTIVTTQPTQSGGQAPYKALTAPCKVEAEDYDTGGEGVAYHDTTAENQGMDYRLAEGVDVDAGGVRHIGYVNTGEWVEYTVTVPAAGTYPTAFRVGSWYPELGARTIAVSVDGSAKGTVTVPITGSDRVYQTVTVPLALGAGQQTIRLTFNGARQNLDWFEIGAGTAPTTTTVAPTATTTVTTTTTAPGAIPGERTIPGRIQAEMFDAGASGSAYRDYNPTSNLVNLGNWKTRDPTGVDLYSSGDTVYVGSVESFEWMHYTVNVVQEGDYAVSFRAGSWGTSANPYPQNPNYDYNQRKIELRVDTPTYLYNVPLTSSTSFQTGNLANTVHLTAGTHQLGIMFLGQNQNFDYMEFTKVS
jgi:parallel beta-helix repeat protein